MAERKWRREPDAKPSYRLVPTDAVVRAGAGYANRDWAELEADGPDGRAVVFPIDVPVRGAGDGYHADGVVGGMYCRLSEDALRYLARKMGWRLARADEERSSE